jgi:hypothetical protein
MDLALFGPAAVIGAAIAITQLYKSLVNIPVDFVNKTIWVPPLVVGIVGAILLGIGTKSWNLIAWDAITYAGAACYAVLIAKRTIS